jgi:hypothetical protein
MYVSCCCCCCCCCCCFHFCFAYLFVSSRLGLAWFGLAWLAYVLYFLPLVPQSADGDELDAVMRQEAEAARQARLAKLKKKKGHHMLMTLTAEATPPKDFYSAKISTFKETSCADKPAVLAEWRAKRAASYVAKQKTDPLHPPPHREAPTVSFRPGGILPAKPAAAPAKRTSVSASSPTMAATGRASLGNSSSSRGVSMEALPLDLSALQAELKKTEEEMARQQLKINLNTRPAKSFEVAKDIKVKNLPNSKSKSRLVEAMLKIP